LDSPSSKTFTKNKLRQFSIRKIGLVAFGTDLTMFTCDNRPSSQIALDQSESPRSKASSDDDRQVDIATASQHEDRSRATEQAETKERLRFGSGGVLEKVNSGPAKRLVVPPTFAHHLLSFLQYKVLTRRIPRAGLSSIDKKMPFESLSTRSSQLKPLDHLLVNIAYKRSKLISQTT